jgi:predicted transcriptional regulator
MNVIYRLIEENRVLDFSKIFNLCIRETDLDSATLFNIIERLKNEKRIEFGHRIIRDFVLINFTRKTIYIYIKEQPGARFIDLQKKLALSNSVLEWNLNILLKFQCIQEVSFNKLRLFGIKNLDKNILILNYLLRNEKVRKILMMLIEKKMQLTEIVDNSGFTYQDIYYLTNQLIKNNILLNEIEGTKKVYVIQNQFLAVFKNLSSEIF